MTTDTLQTIGELAGGFVVGIIIAITFLGKIVGRQVKMLKDGDSDGNPGMAQISADLKESVATIHLMRNTQIQIVQRMDDDKEMRKERILYMDKRLDKIDALLMSHEDRIRDLEMSRKGSDE